jgi:RNA polymerase sigma factor for flagellar operon FliA
MTQFLNHADGMIPAYQGKSSMLLTDDAPPMLYTRQGRDRSRAELLVREHMPLVQKIAWHVFGSVSSAIELQDLVQMGLVALIEAANSFEDRGQVTFAQYAKTRVRGAMIDGLRRQATLTRGAMQRRRELVATEKALTQELGRQPEHEEVAARLGVTLDRLHSQFTAAQPVRFESIDGVYADDSPWFMSEEANPFEQLESAEMSSVLQEAIGELAEREALVLQLYYVEELNLEEIGQVLEVGAARVCQIKKAAHDKLRKRLADVLG